MEINSIIHVEQPSPPGVHRWRSDKRDEQTDRQTDRQTDNRQTDKKTQRFWPLWRRVKSESHQTWHGDRGPRARSCSSKTFSGQTHSFAATGC